MPERLNVTSPALFSFKVYDTPGAWDTPIGGYGKMVLGARRALQHLKKHGYKLRSVSSVRKHASNSAQYLIQLVNVVMAMRAQSVTPSM